MTVSVDIVHPSKATTEILFHRLRTCLFLVVCSWFLLSAGLRFRRVACGGRNQGRAAEFDLSATKKSKDNLSLSLAR